MTPNDPGDGDVGANGLGLQNFPVLTGAVGGCGSTTIAGTLDAMFGSYRLEFFANPTCDPSGAGEGAVMRGAAMIHSEGSAQSCWVMLGGSAYPGQAVMATASAEGLETSVFSRCLSVSLPTCAVEGCGDDDPCTLDGCSGAGVGCCVHDPRSGFDGASCIFDEGGFDAPACQGESVPRGVTERFARTRTLLGKARAIGAGERARRLTASAGKALGGAIPVTNKAVKRGRLTTSCGEALVAFLSDGRDRAQALARTM